MSPWRAGPPFSIGSVSLPFLKFPVQPFVIDVAVDVQTVQQREREREFASNSFGPIHLVLEHFRLYTFGVEHVGQIHPPSIKRFRFKTR